MSSMSKAAKAEQAEAITKLRAWIKPGDTVYTVLDHVSASGMSRHIRVVLPVINRRKGHKTDVDFLHPNYTIGKALGLAHGKRNGREVDGLLVGGCGMDMGFHLVYELSHTLYGKGYKCLGKGKCPSNYHVNHRDTIQCPGTEVYNPDGPNSGDRCHWRSGVGWVLGDWDEERDPVLCPTCEGKGRLPNPDGPERFDLRHTDGYALRHRWL